MNRKHVFFIILVSGFAYWIYRKSKAVVTTAVNNDNFSEVMTPEFDLH